MSKANLSENELAYLAGFIDGDGSIMAQIVQRPDYTDIKFQIRLSVVLFQKTSRKHFLVQIQNNLGKGLIRDRNDDMTELSFVGSDLVLWLLKSVGPFLRMKKKQCNLVIKIIEQLPGTKNSRVNFLSVCELSDQVSDLNDSRKRTITSQFVRESLQDFPGGEK